MNGRDNNPRFPRLEGSVRRNNEWYTDSRLRRTQQCARNSKDLLEGAISIVSAIGMIITGLLKLTKK